VDKGDIDGEKHLDEENIDKRMSINLPTWLAVKVLIVVEAVCGATVIVEVQLMVRERVTVKGLFLVFLKRLWIFDLVYDNVAGTNSVQTNTFLPLQVVTLVRLLLLHNALTDCREYGWKQLARR
jgi:hypothetical protein